MLVNGAVQQGPYLSGNPTLRGEISQISGTCSCANQEYNALQATLRKRFSAGLEYQVAFTYSKGMSDSIGYYGQGGQAGSQSAYMAEPVQPSSPSGARPTSTTSSTLFLRSVYELPFGKGRKYGSNMNKVADGILGGWQAGRRVDHAHRLPADHQDERRSFGDGRSQLPRQRHGDAEQSAPDRTGRFVPGSERLRRSGAVHVWKLGSRRGARAGLRLASTWRWQGVPPDREEVLRTALGGLRGDQYADLREPGVADHHFAAVRTDP